MLTSQSPRENDDPVFKAEVVHEVHVGGNHHRAVLREEADYDVVRVRAPHSFDHLCKACLPDGYELLADVVKAQSRRAGCVEDELGYRAVKPRISQRLCQDLGSCNEESRCRGSMK